MEWTLDSSMVKNLKKMYSLTTSFTVPEDKYIIGSHAFEYFRKVENVILHDKVEKIELAAFCNCKELKSINLPESLLYLEQAAFSGCSSLRKIEVPFQIECIEPWTFGDCESLKEVVLPRNLQKFCYKVFENTDNIEKITFTGGKFSSANGRFIIESDCLYDKTEKTLIKSFGDKEEITVLEGTKSIDARAFSNRKNLKKITLPKSLEKIDNPFRGCDSLSDISFPNGNDFFEIQDGMLLNKEKYILYRVFSQSEECKVPESVTDIRSSALPVYIEQIILPAGLKKLNLSASDNPEVTRNFIKVVHDEIKQRKLNTHKICDIDFVFKRLSAEFANFMFYINGEIHFNKKIFFDREIALHYMETLENILSSKKGCFTLEIEPVTDKKIIMLIDNSESVYENAILCLDKSEKYDFALAMKIGKIILTARKIDFVSNFYSAIIKAAPHAKSGLIESIIDNGNLQAIYERM